MVNRRADIYFENVDGSSEDYLTGDECPFDLNQPVVDIPDDDFGVWYVDVMDHPDRWAGKEVHMKLLMCHSKKYPGIHCPGRPSTGTTSPPGASPWSAVRTTSSSWDWWPRAWA